MASSPLTAREIENRHREAYADYVDRRTAAREAYAAECAAADAEWTRILDELNALRAELFGPVDP